MPVRTIVTKGTRADCKEACNLIKNINAQHLLADKGYDSNEIINHALKQNIQPVIPPKKNRKYPRYHDKYLYKYRHLVENAFLHLKQFRSIATRYAKHSNSFLAAIHIRCITLWLK